MAFIRNISIEGLFGLYNHSIDVRSDPRVTIVAGPNGIGKTTLLGLTQALLKGAYRDLVRHRFERLTVTSDTGAVLSASPQWSDGDAVDADAAVVLELRRPRFETLSETVRVTPPSFDFPIPPFLEVHGRDSYFDTRYGEILSIDEVISRFGRHRGRAPTIEQPEWYDPDEWLVDFIETKRLDTLIARAPGPRRREAQRAPIHFYLSAVRDALEQARRESTRTRQAHDRSFARRLLSKASQMTVNEEKLRARYAEVGARAEQLTANGLLSDSLDVLPKGKKLTPTEKRIVSLFLDDFEAKLGPLDPVSAKLDQMRSVIGHKFVNKTMAVHPIEGVVFVAEPDRRAIDPDALSSGEQHELALISRLLFTEAPGTTVLIDEPELSLHVSWQHEMVDDLIDIAEVADLSFILATHSTAIINGRWDLVEELGPLDTPVIADRPRQAPAAVVGGEY